MDYEKFKQEFSLKVEELLSEKRLNVTSKSILKNNGCYLDGLIVSNENSRISPVLYVNEFYDSYLRGLDFDELTEDVIKVVDNAFYKLPEIPEMTREYVEEHLYAKVINAGANKELLTTVPHRILHDLAVIPCIAVNTPNDNASAKITNDMLSVIKMTKDEVIQKAIENTEKQSFECVSMMEMLLGMISADFKPEESETPEELLDDIIRNEKDNSMFVVLNRKQNNGSAILVCKSSLEKAVQEVGEDCYILPSSIYEVMLVPKNGVKNEQELLDMVREINRTQVAPGEVLSDNIYQYNLAAKKLTMITGEELEEVIQPKRVMYPRI